MKGRWRFDLPGNRTAVVVLLLMFHVGLSFSWSLNDQGLELSKFRDRVFGEAVEALVNWNKDVGETRSCSWLGFGCSVDKDVSLDTADPGDFSYRRLLQGTPLVRPGRSSNGPTPLTRSSSSTRNRTPSNSISEAPLSPSPLSNSPSPSPSNSPISSPAPSPLFKPNIDPPVAKNRSNVVVPAPQVSRPILPPSPALTQTDTRKTHRVMAIVAGVLGGAFFLLISAVGVVLFRSSKVVTVKPWATGLSGQLQKAFVTGVPKLNRSEIVVACEDFSNIIGTFSEGTVYKGTLSSGVEIAVTSTAVKCRQDWSNSSEEQFRRKIEKLSKMNHKNFVNLIGFCEEEEPFTRVMVFEYAPNGTLFEHLHIKEAEHLDWNMRLRIAMGIAYSLEHMHQLTPPIVHMDLHSSSVYLTEDYAAKISDFRFWNEMTEAKMESASKKLSESRPADPESNVYSFGVILFEVITGRIPYSVENCSLEDWASVYLKAEHSLREMVDPTLTYFNDEELKKLFQVIKDCVNPDPKERPRMVEISARLKEITAMGPDGAMPKLSPLWWAELEILSSEGS